MAKRDIYADVSLPKVYREIVVWVIEYILLARTFDETTKHNKEYAKNLQEITIDLADLVNFIEESINMSATNIGENLWFIIT